MDRIRQHIDRTGSAARWIAVALWMGVIFRFSALPGSDVPGKYGSAAHFVEYAVLGALLWFALVRNSRMAPLAAAIVVASFYGITDEFHQYFVPGRVPDVADWGVDTLGACAGALLAARLMKKGAP